MERIQQLQAFQRNKPEIEIKQPLQYDTTTNQHTHLTAGVTELSTNVTNEIGRKRQKLNEQTNKITDKPTS